MRHYALIGSLTLLTGCTTIGFHDAAARALALHPGRPPTTVRLCAYLDDGIDRRHVETLLADAWNAKAEGVGIRWEIVRAAPYPRPAYSYPGIKEHIDALTLPTDCDRLMAFIGRHPGDALYGLMMLAAPLPEVLGYVDDIDRTRGYTVATRATLMQLLMSPAGVLRHELYHMLGCEHSITLKGCYQTIADMRRLAGWVGYFPGWDPEARRAVRLPGR